MIELYDLDSPEKAVKAAQELTSFFRGKFPDIELVLHGEDRLTWPIIYYAKANGLSFRVGLEDTLVDEEGRKLLSNKDLYEEALKL